MNPLRLTRRALLGAAAIGAASASTPGSGAAAILQRIKPPVFPQRDFDVTRFGASGGGKRDSTEAIAKAIAACASAGGGRVLVPNGTFLTGAIHLKSNVNLHVAAGATLLFSRDPKQYLPVVFTRFEGTECMNYSPLLYAFGETNVAITGAGTLDGQADCEYWWPWKGRRNCGWEKGGPNQEPARDALVQMGDKDVPVRDRIFGDGHYLRPNFIQPYRCNNVLIEDITIKRSPMWEVNPVLCRNVTVRGVRISSHGPNNDGCDPECSTDVFIKDCVFDTGDDCIAIKSGRNRDGRRVGVACENVVIQGCTMKDGHGGVSIGSEVSGGIRNVFVDSCQMSSPNLDRVLRIKSNSYRGGVIENVYFRHVTVGQVSAAAIEIDFYYAEGPGGPLGGGFQPVAKNIVVEDVTCHRSQYALYFRGYKTAPIRDIQIADCVFEDAAKPNVIENVQGLSVKNVVIDGKPWRV